jgi:hypothetical protein
MYGPLVHLRTGCLSPVSGFPTLGLDVYIWPHAESLSTMSTGPVPASWMCTSSDQQACQLRRLWHGEAGTATVPTIGSRLTMNIRAETGLLLCSNLSLEGEFITTQYRTVSSSREMSTSSFCRTSSGSCMISKSIVRRRRSPKS